MDTAMALFFNIWKASRQAFDDFKSDADVKDVVNDLGSLHEKLKLCLNRERSVSKSNACSEVNAQLKETVKKAWNKSSGRASKSIASYWGRGFHQKCHVVGALLLLLHSAFALLCLDFLASLCGYGFLGFVLLGSPTWKTRVNVCGAFFSVSLAGLLVQLGGSLISLLGSAMSAHPLVFLPLVVLSHYAQEDKRRRVLSSEVGQWLRTLGDQKCLSSSETFLSDDDIINLVNHLLKVDVHTREVLFHIEESDLDVVLNGMTSFSVGKKAMIKNGICIEKGKKEELEAKDKVKNLLKDLRSKTLQDLENNSVDQGRVQPALRSSPPRPPQPSPSKSWFGGKPAESPRETLPEAK
jgi:hypothetical protein